MNKIILLIVALAVSGCALTPEQQAKRDAERKAYEQNLQVALASQCDKETAQLMRQKFDEIQLPSDKERQEFRLKYIDKVNDPMFQACYKMAWQSYVSQQQLRQMRDYYDDWYGWRGFHRPWGWW